MRTVAVRNSLRPAWSPSRAAGSAVTVLAHPGLVYLDSLEES